MFNGTTVPSRGQGFFVATGPCRLGALKGCRPTLLVVAVLGLTCLAAACDGGLTHRLDDARKAGRTAADFPQVTADIFKAMDGGLELTTDEVMGRNTWILWTAGNQVFWDRIARESHGLIDLVKTLDSRKRPRRFTEAGLINEPGFRMAENPDVFGLWLDERAEPAPAGIDEQIYGRSSGVIGFRIYPNPEFDAAARRRWDPQRYYRDRDYFTDPRLVRPYRIGVTCGLCHVGFHPLRPPADPAHPRWDNLASAIGNQYLREGRVFAFDLPPDSFLREMLEAQPPGTSDTSRVANDHINNPGAINAIFGLGARLASAVDEEIGGEAQLLAGGAAGAVMRVYVNEGLYSQQWLTDHDILLGLRPQRPFSVANAFENSTYWQATWERVGNIAKFFARITPMYLADAPGGRSYLTNDSAVLDRGQIVFADHCAGCHSSKQPPPEIDPRSPQGRQWYRQSVMRADFRASNFLSTDRRYSVSVVKTNACRALATNATAGHIWANFSSETYKQLPRLDPIDVFDPTNPTQPYRFNVPGGGIGYYRPPSLISLWTSAPFLHNNAVGVFNGDPSVAGRLRAFDDAIERLLWPEKRAGTASIWVTTRPSSIEIPAALVPSRLRPLLGKRALQVGPIPPGTPINLVANVRPNVETLLALIPAVNAAWRSANSRDVDDGTARALMNASMCPDLIEDRGHEFGTKLADADKRALIEFLKTL
jgi:hypothetical protein